MKSVLFVSLGFHSYDSKMAEAITRLGYDVTLFIPMGKYNTIEKVINNVTKSLPGRNYLERKCYRRQKKYMNNNPKKYDIVLVIVGRHLDPQLLKEYREAQPQAKFILYLWDDIARVEQYDKNKVFYDEIYSFDLKDVEQYGLKHHPLFYLNEYLYKGEEKKYQLGLTASIHSGRTQVWDKIINKYKIDINKCSLYLLGMTMKDYISTVTPPRDKWINLKYVHIKGLSTAQMSELAKKTKITLDVQFSSQAGLTIRTFESLASNTKLITTNPYVKEYDFYEYGNICVIDKENPEIPEVFFETAYNEVPEEIVNKYSVDNWMRTMIGEGK